MSDEKKHVCYMCTGCGIGERLDADQLEMIATREGKLKECKSHEMLCSVEGVQMIREDIDSNGVTHVHPAACSRRLKVEAFNFSDVAAARANLREGVIWARPEGDEHQETTQELAEDYFRMGAAELKAMNKPAPSGEQGLNRRILVVGGGITGMTAALEAGAAGYEVHLVEKTGALGGHAATLYKRVPFRAAAPGENAPLPQAEEPGVDALVDQIQDSAKNTVHLNSTVTNEDTEMAADLVVLATGMVANSGPDPYAEEGEESEEAPAEVTASVDSILNLDYRQGTDLPHLKHGFVDSQFICFPYETRRTGIYAAGPVRRQMDMKQAMDDATGAAMKAIQSIENAAGGSGVHPRVGDLSYPSFRKEGCTQCKRCTVECPFGAINEDEKQYPVFNESRCRRCGTCMGACPVCVISFENYSVETVGAQIKNCDIPDEFDEKPRILVLACENDAYPALDQATMSGQEISPWARVISVRCLGSVSMSWVTDAMNSGYDDVVLMGCRRDDDYQCHFVRGSALAAERMGKVGDTLETLNLEPERVAVHEVAITDIERAPQLIQDMADVVERVGMSPFKF